MASPKIYYDTVKKKWIVVDKNGNSGAICFGNCNAGSVEPLPCGNTGVFGGGYNGNYLSNIDYVKISTPGNAQNFGNLTVARYGLGATSNGINNRGVFGGGYTNASISILSNIDYITISTPGNAQNFGSLMTPRYGIAATSNSTNNRGVFAGGYTTSNHNVSKIDFINISTPSNAHNFGDLTVARHGLGATSNGTNDRGVFGGGHVGITNSIIIDYITISTPGNAKKFGSLITSRYGLAATSNSENDTGVFGGGYNGNYLSEIDSITISTPGNAQNFGNLSVGRYYLAATSNGTRDRGLFGGGHANSGYTSVISYFIFSTLIEYFTNFGDLTIARSRLAATSNA